MSDNDIVQMTFCTLYHRTILKVRADLLKSQNESFVLSQLAIMRRHSQGLPIIYTVRSSNQGGAFPDDEAAFWRLMLVGLR